jgi:hypothetical protein
MTGATDWQKLGNALDQAENHRFPNRKVRRRS